MSEPLFVALLLLCGGTLIWALRRPEGLYLYPALAALVIIGWVIPQVWRLLDYPDLPDGALPLTMTMIVLSFTALLLGWRSGAAALPALPPFAFDNSRLLWGAVALSVFGAYFRFAIRDLPDELLEMSQWSGPQTIYAFFARTQFLAFALAWLIFLRTKSWLALGIVVFNALFLADEVFVRGKRGTLIIVGITIFVALWFERKWAPPRVALVASALALTIVFTIIGEYRAATSARTVYTDRLPLTEVWANLKRIDVLDSFRQTVESRDPQRMEVYNAILVIGATQENLAFDGFATYWDRMIFQYVPGQLVGFDLKYSLMFSTADPMLDVYGQRSHVGTTRTGFADAFRSFWLFGALVFGAFAWMMRVCWDRAMQGQLLFQFLYLTLLKDGLHAITHSTAWFVVFWPFIIIFATPIFWFAFRSSNVMGAPVDRRPNVIRRNAALNSKGMTRARLFQSQRLVSRSKNGFARG